MRIIGNGGEKRKQRKTHRRRLLLENREWGVVVVGSYSLCGVRIRRGGDSLDKNPLLLFYGGGTEDETRTFLHT